MSKDKQKDWWCDGHYIAAPTEAGARKEVNRLYDYEPETVRRWATPPGNWRVVEREPDWPDQDHRWTVVCDNPEALDGDSFAASAEDGQYATREEAEQTLAQIIDSLSTD